MSIISVFHARCGGVSKGICPNSQKSLDLDDRVPTIGLSSMASGMCCGLVANGKPFTESGSASPVVCCTSDSKHGSNKVFGRRSCNAWSAYMLASDESAGNGKPSTVNRSLPL